MTNYLISLDQQIGEYNSLLIRDVKLNPHETGKVATTIWSEVAKNIDTIVSLYEDKVSIDNRLVQMHNFIAWNATFSQFIETLPTDLRANVGATGLVVNIYYSFVYLKDSLFQILSKLSTQTVSARCSNYLLAPNNKAIRNAFSHGNWIAPGNGILTYWAREKWGDPSSLQERQMKEREFDFLLRLSRGVGVAAFDAMHLSITKNV